MAVSPVSNMDIKRRNRSNTMRCILASGRISQMELTQRLALSWPTILQNVKELTELGLVREAGVYESTGGRKAKAYAPVPEARAAVGLDLTPHHVNVVLADLGGRLICRARGVRRFAADDGYMRYLGDMLQRFVEANGVSGRLLGVGISLPGIVDEERGVLRDSRALEVSNVSLALFRQRIPWPCRFLNAVSAAGIAETCGNAAAGDQIYLSLGDSVGSAILREGRLYLGGHLRAGAFGHSTLVPNGRRCWCGKAGCLDAYCSAKALSDHAGGRLSVFFDRLRTGDPQMQKIWREYLEYLAVAVNNLYVSFDCGIIVGGSVGAYLKEFGELLRALLAERNPFEADASYLKNCRYQLEASAAGAALTLVESFLQEL